MATFQVRFNGGYAKRFELNKTLTEIKAMIEAALTAGELIKVGDLLLTPQNIVEVEELKPPA